MFMEKFNTNENNRVVVLLSLVSKENVGLQENNIKISKWNIDMEMPNKGNIKCPDGIRLKMIDYLKNELDDLQKKKHLLVDGFTEETLKLFIAI